MHGRLNRRAAAALGLFAAALLALLALWAADRSDRAPSTPAEPLQGAAPGKVPEGQASSPRAPSLAQPGPVEPSAALPIELPRLPLSVASLAGALPAQAAGQVHTIEAWGASGRLADQPSGTGGRFLLELPRQETPGELAIRFAGGWSAWLGPFDLDAGSRHEIPLMDLPGTLAARSGRLEPPGPAELELEERHGSLWLTQRVAVQADGKFSFLAARAGPFWARAEGGRLFLAAGRPGLAAEDPLPFRPPPAIEAGSPLPEPRRRAWEQGPAAPAREQPADADPAAARVGFSLVDGRGRALADLPLELELAATWTSPDDPGRPPLPVALEFQALSGTDGRCEFSGLPPGRARIGAPREAPWMSLEAREFDLGPGEALELGVLVLTGLSSLTGTCRDVHGRALLGAKLRYIQPGLARPIETASDEQGRFRFERLPAGSGEVLLLPPASFPGLGRMRRVALEAPADGALELEISLAP
jgi:hypothetical protein